MAVQIKTEEALVMTLEDLHYMETPAPRSWTRAAGLLKHKKNALLRHLGRVRSEWQKCLDA
ncbi:MAG: hypothetical protein Q8R20_01260 [Nanoarchaeota archaeon]|nr:hypothetical protein [Nanoarchaeota archaeon]